MGNNPPKKNAGRRENSLKAGAGSADKKSMSKGETEMTKSGTTFYHLNADEMRRLRAAARKVRTDWRPFASRPALAREMIERIEAGNLEPIS